MKKLALAIAICLLLPLSAMADEIPELGNTALQAMLEKNRGKVVLINFFATWCPPCRMELPELVKLRDMFPKDKFTLIGLSLDEDRTAVGPFVKLAGTNYPIYMANSTITDAYNISSVPHNTFIAPDGSIVISEPGMADVEVLKKEVEDLLKGMK